MESENEKNRIKAEIEFNRLIAVKKPPANGMSESIKKPLLTRYKEGEVEQGLKILGHEVKVKEINQNNRSKKFKKD